MDTQISNVMMDIETFGLTPGNVVRTVSVAEFAPKTGKVYRKKTWTISLQDSLNAGFTIEADTLKWWLLQSETARKELVSSPEEESSLSEFVSDFIYWFSPYSGNVNLWALQVDFDTSMLRCYLAYYYHRIFRKEKVPIPWDRKRLIDVRPYIISYADSEVAIHTSMGDCLCQIKAVADYYTKMQYGSIDQGTN